VINFILNFGVKIAKMYERFFTVDNVTLRLEMVGRCKQSLKKKRIKINRKGIF